MKTARNVIANVGGRLWQVLMNFAFIPLYVHSVGVEAYGLVGIFATMLAVFGVLDMGLSLAVNRELVRLNAAGELARARNLVRSLELVYWGMGAAIAALIYLGAGFIVHHWLNLSNLSAETAILSVELMALVALLRWPGALYTGVLMGLREHVALNLITALVATLSGAGALLVLWLVSPSITAFFTWQIIAAAMQIALFYAVTWRKLAVPGHRAAFDFQALWAIFHFSAGIFGVTILSIVLTQLDKLVLSSTLSLTQFGYYTLAFTIGNVLATVGAAIYGALFPSLSHVVETGREDEIAAFYHKCCQLMAAAIIPAGMALVFFAPDLLQIYFQNSAMVQSSYRLVVLFGIANTIFALMMMPYALQLAFGWTRLSIYKNIVAIALYIPALFVLVRTNGAVGAAMSWLVLMCGYLLFEIGIMHRRLLKGEIMRWYVRDVGLPMIIGVLLLGAAHLVAGAWMPLPARFALCVLSAALALTGIIALSPELRQWVLSAVLRNRFWGQLASRN